MDFKIFKDTSKEIKKGYGKMYTLGLGIVLLCIVAVVLKYAESYLGESFPASSISLIIIFFGVLPLLLSYELVCSRILTEHQVNYNEIYKNYKAYFSVVFRGCYGVILSSIICFLIYDIANSIYIYANADYDLLISAASSQNYEAISEEITRIINLNAYGYFYIFVIGLVALVFFSRVFLKMSHPYFSFFVGLPIKASKRVVKQINKNTSHSLFKQLIMLYLPLLLAFIFIYNGIAFPVYYFYQNLALSIGLSFIIFLVISSFYLPFYVSGCFILAYNNREVTYKCIRKIVDQELMAILKDKSINDELKKQAKDSVDVYKNMFNINDETNNQQKNNDKENDNKNDEEKSE